MSGILGKMKAVARGGHVPIETEDDNCEICRMLATHGTVVETIELPDGSVVELRSMPDGAPPLPGMQPWPPGFELGRKGGAR